MPALNLSPKPKGPCSCIEQYIASGFRVEGVKVLPKSGVHFWGSHSKTYSFLGSMFKIGVPLFRNVPFALYTYIYIERERGTYVAETLRVYLATSLHTITFVLFDIQEDFSYFFLELRRAFICLRKSKLSPSLSSCI